MVCIERNRKSLDLPWIRILSVAGILFLFGSFVDFLLLFLCVCERNREKRNE
jgi:hypothetical protein